MFARTAACLSCLLLCSVEPQLAYADGKLARARREAASSSDDDERGHGGERGHDDHHHSRSFVESLLCGLFSCDDDDHHHHHHHHDSEVALSVGADEVAREPAPAYAPYPYASPLAPYLLDAELQVASTSSALDVQLRRAHVAGRPFAGQLSIDGGYLGGVAHSGMDARLLTPSPFELGARTALLYEPSARDYSLFGAAEVGLRFASLRVLSVRASVGPAWFGKPSEMLYGVELGLGLDVYLGRPWVLSARASGAMLGDLLCPQARLQLGYLFGRAEVFAAYEYLRVGSVDLSTPLFGTRIWL
ncbi:MAG TPA: hypothetical protein VJR89_15280 [Polyangiales bacterium]|nr:hypothetical protein [Polyangiales bacterium]